MVRASVIVSINASGVIPINWQYIALFSFSFRLYLEKVLQLWPEKNEIVDDLPFKLLSYYLKTTYHSQYLEHSNFLIYCLRPVKIFYSIPVLNAKYSVKVFKTLFFFFQIFGPMPSSGIEKQFLRLGGINLEKVGRQPRTQG